MCNPVLCLVRAAHTTAGQCKHSGGEGRIENASAGHLQQLYGWLVGWLAKVEESQKNVAPLRSARLLIVS